MSQGAYGRIVFIGESGVGKTSIIDRLLNSSSGNPSPTIGAVFHSHTRAVDGVEVNLQIWDTAGQERYRGLGPIYYRKANGAIAVFDLASRETMEKLDFWIDKFKEHADDKFVVIVANKNDLEPAVTYQEIQALEEKHNATCLRASAITGENITEIFQTMCQHLAEKQTASNNRCESLEETVQMGDGKASCGGC
jgi:small GTP-binding protein